MLYQGANQAFPIYDQFLTKGAKIFKWTKDNVLFCFVFQQIALDLLDIYREQQQNNLYSYFTLILSKIMNTKWIIDLILKTKIEEHIGINLLPWVKISYMETKT